MGTVLKGALMLGVIVAVGISIFIGNTKDAIVMLFYLLGMGRTFRPEYEV